MRIRFQHLALAALVAAPAWSIQVSLPDSTAKLDIGVLMQNRADINSSENAAGKEFDVNRGKTAISDPIDFYGRRARLSAKLERGSWTGFLMFSADNTDPTSTNSSRNPKLLYLWAQNQISSHGITHTFTMGLDKVHAQPSFDDPSSQLLFPTSRATTLFPSPTSAYGLRYQMGMKNLEISADVQNTHNAERATVRESEGLFYAGRLVFAPVGALPKRTESYMGEAGKSLAIGADVTFDPEEIMVDKGGNGTPQTADDTVSAAHVSFGGDILAHYNEITAIVDARFQNFVRPTNTVQSQVITAQVGYAIPAGKLVVEPAVRFAIIDKDVDNTDADKSPQNYSSSANSEHGNSGYEGDVGVNLYFRKHANKLQIAFSRWESENSDAYANILRVQHQFSF
ncbi:MAG TPA: hypothetical protein PKO15_14820 [Fibrobacteria bacterium]|nr:hypothetical protein [Fibrobacteria bacterium]HOX52901.1 hypothetical protein [Fibrobacteria bacterium]